MHSGQRAGVCVLATLTCTLIHGISSTAEADTPARFGHWAYTQTASSCAQADQSVCNDPDTAWTWHDARDDNTVSAWSSRLSLTSDATEWIAIFWSSVRSTNYLTYIPRVVGTQAYHVPEWLQIDYHVCDPTCRWQSITTVSLPANMSPSGYTIFFNTVTTDGLRLLTSRLRPDPTATSNYYFQIAELYAGYGPNEKPTKQLSYAGFSCDVYGYSKTKVLDNTSEQLAYDFSVTQLTTTAGPKQYAAVFHSEPFNKPAGSVGDSTAVVYGSSPDGPFVRTGDDHVVSRTENTSHFMRSDQTSRGVSGGANPILLKRGGTQQYDYAWTLFYLSVADVTGENPVVHDDNVWRHFLHVGHPYDVTNMQHTTWASLARNLDNASNYWHWFSDGGSLKWRSYEPWPARYWPSGNLLASDYAAVGSEPGGPHTQGLIGNMTYNQPKTKVYYFSLEGYPGSELPPRTVRREMYDIDTVNYWREGSKVDVFNDWTTKIAYYDLFGGHWAVFKTCGSSPGWDLCMNFTLSGTDNLEEFSSVDAKANPLGLNDFFDDAAADWGHNNGHLNDGGIMTQIGILKNPYGQLFSASGDFRLYVSERVRGGAVGGLYGMDMYSIRVTCH